MAQEGAAEPDSPSGAALHRPAVHEGHLGRAANDLHPSAHVHPPPHPSVSTDVQMVARACGGKRRRPRLRVSSFTRLLVFQVAALGGKRGDVSLHGRRQVHAALHQERRTEDLRRPRQVLLTRPLLHSCLDNKGSHRLLEICDFVI